VEGILDFGGTGETRDLSIALEWVIAIPMLQTSSMGQGRKDFERRLSEIP